VQYSIETFIDAIANLWNAQHGTGEAAFQPRASTRAGRGLERARSGIAKLL
jgi:hypothetical protein